MLKTNNILLDKGDSSCKSSAGPPRIITQWLPCNTVYPSCHKSSAGPPRIITQWLPCNTVYPSCHKSSAGPPHIITQWLPCNTVYPSCHKSSAVCHVHCLPIMPQEQCCLPCTVYPSGGNLQHTGWIKFCLHHRDHTQVQISCQSPPKTKRGQHKLGLNSGPSHFLLMVSHSLWMTKFQTRLKTT